MTQGGSDNESSASSRSPDWEALARALDGKSSPGDALRMSAGDREVLGKIEALTASLGNDIPKDLDVDAALAKVKSRREFTQRDVIPLDAPSRRRWHVPMPALAAAAFFAVGVASWMAYSNRPRETAGVASAPRM